MSNKILIIKTGNTIPSLLDENEDFEDWFICGLGFDSSRFICCAIDKGGPLRSIMWSAQSSPVRLPMSPILPAGIKLQPTICDSFMRGRNQSWVFARGINYWRGPLAVLSDFTPMVERSVPSTWAVQFHPEFSAHVMSTYIRERSDDIAEEGLDVEELLARVDATPVSAGLLRYS